MDTFFQWRSIQAQRMISLNQKKPLGTRAVESLIECVTQAENHSFDRQGFQAIGTIRDNRTKKELGAIRK